MLNNYYPTRMSTLIIQKQFDLFPLQSFLYVFQLGKCMQFIANPLLCEMELLLLLCANRIVPFVILLTNFSVLFLPDLNYNKTGDIKPFDHEP